MEKKATTIARASNADNVCSCLVHPTSRNVDFHRKANNRQVFFHFLLPFAVPSVFFIPLIYPFAKLYKFVCRDLVTCFVFLFLLRKRGINTKAHKKAYKKLLLQISKSIFKINRTYAITNNNNQKEEMMGSLFYYA